jgi:hypothetical protein
MNARSEELGRKIGQSQAFMFIAQFGFSKRQIA